MRAALIAILVILVLVVIVLATIYFVSVQMPRGSRMSVTADVSEARIRQHVAMLAGTIGERNVMRPEALTAAAGYIEQTLRELGYAPRRQTFTSEGVEVANIVVDLPSAPDAPLLVVGAHYDSVDETPGADDNASGVAALLEIARALRGAKLKNGVQLVFWVNEEPPHFKTSEMGSVVHAESLIDRKVIGALSLETLGYFSEVSGSQRYPAPLSLFYPSQGNFIAFVGDLSSRALARRSVGLFRSASDLPAQGAALPRTIDPISWSDHWSYWRIGAPALMVTDTALFRNPNYHRSSDTVETLDYARLTEAARGIAHVVRGLAN